MVAHLFQCSVTLRHNSNSDYVFDQSEQFWETALTKVSERSQSERAETQ